MKKNSSPQSILITGATSGIGKALAICFAKPETTLFLSGRDTDRLNNVIAECENLGARAIGKIVDVCDQSAMTVWINESHKISPLDLIVANAGISIGTQDDMNFEKSRDIFLINLMGLLNTVHPAIQNLRQEKGGQIALVSSIAGYRGLPSAPAYSASKTAVKAYGEGLRGQLAPENINVSVICPGFVKSGITDRNNFPMPFLMDAAQAAQIIKKGLAKNKALIAFPWQMHLIGYFLSILPSSFAIKILSKLPSK